jgi:hypothetical protein
MGITKLLTREKIRYIMDNINLILLSREAEGLAL